MKIEWPAAYPGAHWFDEREDRAVLDVQPAAQLQRYYLVVPGSIPIP
jgi:hypothetical protein